VIGVLDSWLQDRQWLVGDKCTYADLSFVTWSHIAEGLFAQFGKSDIPDRYPRYSSWYRAMNERVSVKEAVASIAAGRAEHGLPP
jgi:glutathione S-transferase